MRIYYSLNLNSDFEPSQARMPSYLVNSSGFSYEKVPYSYEVRALCSQRDAYTYKCLSDIFDLTFLGIVPAGINSYYYWKILTRSFSELADVDTRLSTQKRGARYVRDLG
jgi:hypothetical protein